MTTLATLVRDVWLLTKSYWGGEERWSARGLLTSVIGLNLGLVAITVEQNQATGALFTALQQQNAPGFYRACVIVISLIVFYLMVAVLRAYLDQTLQLRWRRWLTDRYVSRWLTDQTFYRMRFSGRIDNPDQRISEDIRLFIERTMALGLGLLNAMANLASFAALLWFLSGSITFSVDGFEITIPGYMFWVAVLYSGLGSVIAHLIGRPLISLYNRQQAVEADFRFALVHLREEAEGVALYGGEAQERRIAAGRFRTLYDNFKRIILRSNEFLFFQLLFSQNTSFFALLIASPRFFSGAIQLGVLTQIANAFERVNEALCWFVGSYTIFAAWRASADRLTEFAGEIERQTTAAPRGPSIGTTTQDTIDLQDVGVRLPDGKPLLDPLTLTLRSHEPVLLRGPSGSGRSTLFRILAGLWPFASGSIRLPAGAKMLFLPQRPYFPIGTLREALWYPADPGLGHEEDERAALAVVGLSGLSQRLGEDARWTQELSLGEQQRLAIAGALLFKPDWLFLDETTSAMNEAEETAIYRMLSDALPATTLVSIGHRIGLDVFHRRVITVDHAGAGPGQVVVQSDVPLGANRLLQVD